MLPFTPSITRLPVPFLIFSRNISFALFFILLILHTQTGIFLTAKRPEESGKGLILSAMVETYAVLGLLATILLLNGIQVG